MRSSAIGNAWNFQRVEKSVEYLSASPRFVAGRGVLVDLVGIRLARDTHPWSVRSQSARQIERVP